MIRHRVFALVVVLLAGCAGTPDPAILMPGHPPGRSYTQAQARDTLERVEQRRTQWQERWSAALARCHGRFLASDCESRVHAERRVVETELDRIALQAQRALREHAAIERNAREAGRVVPEGAAAHGITESTGEP